MLAQGFCLLDPQSVCPNNDLVPDVPDPIRQPVTLRPSAVIVRVAVTREELDHGAASATARAIALGSVSLAPQAGAHSDRRRQVLEVPLRATSRARHGIMTRISNWERRTACPAQPDLIAHADKPTLDCCWPPDIDVAMDITEHRRYHLMGVSR